METAMSLSAEGDGLLQIFPSLDSDTFRLVGELDASCAAAIGDRLAALLESSPRMFLDLSALSFLDCTGLRVFLRLGELASSMDGRTIVLVHPARIVKKVIEIAAPTGIPGVEILD